VQNTEVLIFARVIVVFQTNVTVCRVLCASRCEGSNITQIENIRVSRVTERVLGIMIQMAPKHFYKFIKQLREGKNQLDATYFIIYSILIYYSLLNMFRPLIRPSSGVADS